MKFSTSQMKAIETEMISWRRHLHQYPEIAFQENQTALFIYNTLISFGIPKQHIKTGIAGTGIVVSMYATNKTNKAIGLRADMDALAIDEKTNVSWQSKNQGTMHACGHDGHMAMLLGAIYYLTKHHADDIKQNIHFIFQPAEENEGGARVMLEEGLFKNFACDQIYGLHNFPGITEGVFVIQEGPVMASFDNFDILVQGKGGHAAMPQLAIDPIQIASLLVTALSDLVNNIDSKSNQVLSITRIDAGSTYNIIPDTALIRGTVRSLSHADQDSIEIKMLEICQSIAKAKGGSTTIDYKRCYPVTTNAHEPTKIARKVTNEIFGKNYLETEGAISMGSEDFSFLSDQVPGCYAKLGTGPIESGQSLHNSGYDFNDNLLVTGASWWAGLALLEEGNTTTI